MKTFRNVVAVLGLLLLLYVGAYWRFARADMKSRHDQFGGPYFSSYEWGDWRKLFVPIGALDYRLNVVRPLRNRCAGHWTSADSPDFVTLARNGDCSFRIGRFEHTGKMEVAAFQSYHMRFKGEGTDCVFMFNCWEKGGSVVGTASVMQPLLFLPGDPVYAILARAPEDD